MHYFVQFGLLVGASRLQKKLPALQKPGTDIKQEPSSFFIDAPRSEPIGPAKYKSLKYSNPKYWQKTLAKPLLFSLHV
jgi:hypothetical protein